MLSQSYSEHRYLLSISLHPSWSFYFFPLLHWTVTGTDGLVCCVMVYFFFSPHISCALWNTVGAGIRLSVLPVLPLTCLGNCFTGGCQIKKYPIWECQRQPVNICPPCLFCPLMWSSCLSVCLSILSRVGTLSATERLEVQQIFMVLFSLSMILWAFKFWLGPLSGLCHLCSSSAAPSW